MPKKDKDLEFIRGMEKLKSAPIKAEGYTSPLEQDVMKVKGGGEWDNDYVKKFENSTEHIDTKDAKRILTGDQFTDKIAKLRALKAAGKKVAGVIPFAGAGMAALQGDPAMAAEELAADAMGPAGMAYEALRSEDAGNVEEERQMLAEREALEKYKQSPARMAKLRALMGGKNE